MPALKGQTIPPTGQRGVAGTLVTKSLVIAGEPQFTAIDHPRGAMLRAYDKSTGREVGAVLMAAPQTGSPMTYLLNGKQYLIVAIGGAGYPGELLALKLPDRHESAGWSQALAALPGPASRRVWRQYTALPAGSDGGFARIHAPMFLCSVGRRA
jgi:hypothetical protein